MKVGSRRRKALGRGEQGTIRGASVKQRASEQKERQSGGRWGRECTWGRGGDGEGRWRTHLRKRKKRGKGRSNASKWNTWTKILTREREETATTTHKHRGGPRPQRGWRRLGKHGQIQRGHCKQKAQEEARGVERPAVETIWRPPPQALTPQGRGGAWGGWNKQERKGRLPGKTSRQFPHIGWEWRGSRGLRSGEKPGGRRWSGSGRGTRVSGVPKTPGMEGTPQGE